MIESIVRSSRHVYRVSLRIGEEVMQHELEVREEDGNRYAVLRPGGLSALPPRLRELVAVVLSTDAYETAMPNHTSVDGRV